MLSVSIMKQDHFSWPFLSELRIESRMAGTLLKIGSMYDTPARG